MGADILPFSILSRIVGAATIFKQRGD